MTREERENAIRCLKLWIEKEPYIQTYKICLEALEQESCEDWYDVPSNEMNLEQARQAVKDLRKKLVEHLEQEPCEDAISRQAVMNYIHRILNQGTGKKKSFEFIQKYVANMPSVNPQKSKIEPRYCDRNICLKNEYNSIGCDECEVTKSQEPNTVIGTGDGAYYRIKALQAQADGEKSFFCSHCGERLENEN